jgi:GntR family transcriptional regulator, transcriptional repressor for pyruvate dehydrogenase complex
MTSAFAFGPGGVDGVDRPRRLSQPRIAEMIADSLRRRILGGELADGDVLPKVDDLLLEFPVSKPSIREAMRILETEGLISVRRGNVGGAVIHSPKAKTAAYMLGMVLQAGHVPLTDLAEALLEFEPACAAKAAESADRVSKLVPVLVGLNAELAERLGDGPAFTLLARRFHDAVVQGCGNATMALVAGALEHLWSNHESNWAQAAVARGEYPRVVAREAQKAVLRTHIRITEAIEDGDAPRTRRLVARHLHETQRYVLAGGRRQLITVEGLSKAPW